MVIAAVLSKKVGAEHIYCPYKYRNYLHNIKHSAYIREGMGNVIEEWLIWRTLREQHGIEVVLTGEECFGWQDIFLDDEESMFATLGINLISKIKILSLLLTKESFDLLSEVSKQNLAQLSSTCVLKDIHNRKDYFYLDQRLFSLLIWRHVISNEVVVRNPWLDNDILDFMTQVPVKYRKGKILYKSTISSMFPNLFKIEVARAGDALCPSYWLSWMSEFKEEIIGELLNGESAVDVLFSQENIKNLLSRDESYTREKQATMSVMTKKLRDIIKNSPPFFYSMAKKINRIIRKDKEAPPSKGILS